MFSADTDTNAVAITTANHHTTHNYSISNSYTHSHHSTPTTQIHAKHRGQSLRQRQYQPQQRHL